MTKLGPKGELGVQGRSMIGFVNMQSVPEMIVGTKFRRGVLVLLGVVGFVLLIACANSANLLLAHAVSRGKEIAIREALGASRGRIAAQLLMESALHGLAAGVAGLVLAYGGIAVLRGIGSINVPRLQDVHLDAPVFVFTFFISLASGILAGLLPAMRETRIDLTETLKRQMGRVGRGRVGVKVRSTLVVVGVTLSLVLLIGAGLLIRSLVRLQAVQLGFDPNGLYIANVRLPEVSYPGVERTGTFYDALLERLRGTPGIASAALVSSAPFAGPNSGLVFARLDHPEDDHGQAPDADFRVVTPGYLRTLGIPIIRGRDLSVLDGPRTPETAIINESMARRFWPDEDPIGARIRVGDLVAGPLVTIFGVVGDARYQSLETSETRPMFYFAAAQRPQRTMNVVFRATESASVAARVRDVVASLDPKLAPPAVKDLAELVGAAFATRRFTLILFGAFAGVAVVLAATGLYGVIACAVSQRTHEIGVRMALGAQKREVLSLVIGQGIRLALAGVILGVLAALFLTRVLRSLLFEVEPNDPLTFLAVSLFLVMVTVIASWLPARRATHVDPMVALRNAE